MLPDCLASCAAGVDEMIIVDTGSSDRTVEIAESYGAHGAALPVERLLLRRPQPRHRRAPPARTSSGSTPTSGSRPATRRGCARWPRQPYREAHWLVETNFTGQEEVGTAANHLALRLWRHRPPYRFSRRDPRADPHLDADRPARAVRDLDAADPPLRLPQEPHRGAQQARAQPDAAAGGAGARRRTTPSRTSTSAPSTSRWTTSPRRTSTSRSRYRLIQREQGWHEIAYASLLATRLIGVRRRVGDIDGADALAAMLLQVYPTLHRPRLRAGPGGPRARRPAAARRSCSSAASRWATRPRGSPAWSAAARSWPSPRCPAWPPTRATPPRPIARLEESLERFPAYLPVGLELADTLLGAEDADPADVLRAPRDGRQRHGHLVAVPRHRVLRARPRRARRGPVPPRARAQRRAPGRHRRPGRGPAHAAALRRRRARTWPSCPIGTPAFLALQRSRALAAVAAGDAAAAEAAAAVFGEGGGDPAETAFLRAFAGYADHDAPGAGHAAGRRVGLLRRAHARRARAPRGVRAVRAPRADRRARRSPTAAWPR